METSGVTSNNLATASSSSSSGGQSIDQELFLKLLTTQLQYQDPFDPIDSYEFTAQVAQFSSLDQLYGVNERLDSLLTTQSTTERLNAAALIGKEIKAAGNSIEFEEGSSATISYDLEADATSVTINIYNSSGEQVRSVTLGSEVSGVQSYVWDGKDDNGNTVEAGTYTFSVEATDTNSNSISVTSYITGMVSGVTFSDTSIYLSVNGTDVSLENVIEIMEGGI